MDCKYEDPYGYGSYCSAAYEDNEGPPLIHTGSRLIAAVVQNDVDILRELLEPKWFNVTDNDDYNLLQISMLTDNKEAFDYILSLEQFPLEFVNKNGETALVLSVIGFVSNDIFVSDYFAPALIKKGVNIHGELIGFVGCEGNTLLHCAIMRYAPEIAKLLIENGIDVNKLNHDGNTALAQVLKEINEDYGETELVAALLTYGADPFITDSEGYNSFELSILKSNTPFVHELFFLYTFDDVSGVTHSIHLEVILKLAESNYELLLQLLQHQIRVIVDDTKACSCARMLLSDNIEHLDLIIEKFEPFIGYVLSLGNDDINHAIFNYRCNMRIRNLGILLESNLRSHAIDYIQQLSCNSTHLYYYSKDEPTISEILLFVLSYGLNLREVVLQNVYDNFGYCELFRILLHMDVNIDTEAEYQKHVMACLMYDVRLDLNNILTNCDKYQGLHKLMGHFADSRLKKLCQLKCSKAVYAVDHKIQDLVNNAETFASLQELARNVFRKYLIEIFQIKTARAFYCIVKSLPVDYHSKKIITYETPLYTLHL